jgi:hypothetical protein
MTIAPQTACVKRRSFPGAFQLLREFGYVIPSLRSGQVQSRPAGGGVGYNVESLSCHIEILWRSAPHPPKQERPRADLDRHKWRKDSIIAVTYPMYATDSKGL